MRQVSTCVGPLSFDELKDTVKMDQNHPTAVFFWVAGVLYGLTVQHAPQDEASLLDLCLAIGADEAACFQGRGADLRALHVYRQGENATIEVDTKTDIPITPISLKTYLSLISVKN